MQNTVPLLASEPLSESESKKPESTAGDGSLVDKAIPGYADQQPSGAETDLVDSVGLMGRIGQRQTEC
ncbi:hypothetical protein TNCT_381361 [Trichonephila clavata]|uniref:Uncharacterized protein n=1 Tax=Trichonephila clavata TaxID=2740835 RepID=A0A8X6KUH6_TRICU|nr:hypothetical protein TNCT_381361 [Trichonephila clavata]